MISSLHVRIPPPWNSSGCRLRQQEPPPQKPLVQYPTASLTKQGKRFISSLAVTGDSKTARRLISKFVASSPQFVALNALSHLLSPDSPHPRLSSLAFPLYMRITEESWFQWNPKLVAELIALVDTQGQCEEAETLTLETISKLESRERELVLFYDNLLDSFCKHNSKRGFDDTSARLNQLMSSSTSVYVKRQALKSMVSGLCEMGQPHEAEKLIEEMRLKGLKPSGFEFKCVIYGYGRRGLFEDMERIVNQMENEGSKVDTVCSNMVLSSYGDHNELSRMILWLQKMKILGIPFSIRTFNSVLNSCSTIMSMLADFKSNDFPLSLAELTVVLNEDEMLLVRELVESSVLDEAMEWDSEEAKLDLHGMHLGSAYLIMLQWMDEMRNRLSNKKNVIPAEVTVVCGTGKHSTVRGESPVKGMVKKMMVRTSSPMRIDRNNIGCFIAKGHVVKDWLCRLMKPILQ